MDTCCAVTALRMLLQIMGHMDVIPFISNGFNIYFPILILLLCGATYFRLGSRVLTFLGFQQFVGDDEMTQELTDEGKELVKRGAFACSREPFQVLIQWSFLNRVKFNLCPPSMSARFWCRHQPSRGGEYVFDTAACPS